jgi:hypothetical protein
MAGFIPAIHVFDVFYEEIRGMPGYKACARAGDAGPGWPGMTNSDG